MAEITNEVLIEELLKLDARMERWVESLDELSAFSRETVRQVAEAQKESKRLELILACRHLGQPDAAQ
jgi:hypothetical protein